MRCFYRAPRGRLLGRPDCKQCVSRKAAQQWRQRHPRPMPEPVAAEGLPKSGSSKSDRVDLGIAIAHATCEPGQRRTCEEIAAYAGVSTPAIYAIEQRALGKMHRRMVQILAELELTRWEEAL